MNNNSILDDEIPTNKTNDSKYQFQVLYEKYTTAAKLANRWKTISMVSLSLYIFYFFMYYAGISFIGNNFSSFLCLIAVIISLVGYFTHFFALQQRAILAYLFPDIPNVRPKKYNIWILITLSILFQILSEVDIFSSNILFYYVIWLFANIITIHLLCLVMQEILLKKYESYFPAIFEQKTFPSIGFSPFIYFTLSVILFFLSFSLLWASVSGRGHNEYYVFSLFSSYALFVNFCLGVLSVILHIQAEKHSVDNKTF